MELRLRIPSLKKEIEVVEEVPVTVEDLPVVAMEETELVTVSDPIPMNAVEEVIEEHYADQSAKLGALPKSESEAELQQVIEEFKAEEIEPRDIGLANDAEKAPAYPVLSAAIKSGSRLAIWLSERI